MLIITRKASESIWIGEDIEIRVTEIGGDRVKIGINAPRDVRIMRGELADTLRLNEEASVLPDPGSLEQLKSLLK